MNYCVVLVGFLLGIGLGSRCRAEVGGTLVDRVLETSAASRIAIPDYSDAIESSDWFLPAYDVNNWRAASGGIGYERSSSNTYDGYFDTDVETLMYDRSASIYIRTTFEISELQPDQYLILQMRYDDAFIAYLNGHEVARSSNVPSSLSNFEGAPSEHFDSLAVQFVEFDLRAAQQHVVEGENLLAIHGFNYRRSSSDFLISAQIDRFHDVPPDGLCFEKLATNPVSGHLGSPAIHSLKGFNGKIYMGFGDWNAHPGPTVLCAYDPATHTFAAEHSIHTDSIGVMREIDGKLWIPSVDPVHYSRFTDLSILHPNGRLEQRSPVGFYHLFDVFERDNGELWMMGSKDANETPTDGGAIYRSSDRGGTWEEITPGFSDDPSRYYWGFELGGEVLFELASYDSETGWKRAGNIRDKVYKPTAITGAGGTRVVYKSSQTPGSSTGTSSLGIATPRGDFFTSAYAPMLDFTTRGSEVFVLTRDATIVRCPDITVAEPQWETLALAGIPRDVRAIEVDAENVYLGTASGELLGIGLDGTSLGGLAAVEDRVPDQFGRCLVIDGDTLAVGAPGKSGALTQSGEVRIFSRESAGGEWVATQTIAPPVEHFGGFFGDSIAISDEVMVVVESGVFTSGDRGDGAMIHVYLMSGGVWNWQRSEAIVYAQSVAIAEGGAYVAQRNAFRRYSLPDLGYVSYTEPTSYYEAYGTLAVGTYGDDRAVVFSGSSGDASRAGAPGTVTAYFPDTRSATTITEDTGGRHGFSIAQGDQRVAVGVPRADPGGDLLQAGSVQMLTESSEFGGLYDERMSIVPPVAEAEDGFGHAVALSGDGQSLLVGAPLSRGPDGERRGAVYLYQFILGEWELLRKFTPPLEKPHTWEFGSTVIIDGSSGIVGSGFTDGMLDDLERLEFIDLDQALPLTYAAWAAEQNLVAPDDEPSADPDRDGIDNLSEFALGGGLDFQPEMRENAAGEQVFYHRQRLLPSSHGLRYSVEFSRDLTSWESATSSSREGDLDWQNVETAIFGGHRYARLRIELLP